MILVLRFYTRLEKMSMIIFEKREKKKTPEKIPEPFVSDGNRRGFRFRLYSRHGPH